MKFNPNLFALHKKVKFVIFYIVIKLAKYKSYRNYNFTYVSFTFQNFRPSIFYQLNIKLILNIFLYFTLFLICIFKVSI